ncbi:MAG: YihY/virulence factor BrkB family protein [Actinomycetota bacterium]
MRRSEKQPIPSRTGTTGGVQSPFELSAPEWKETARRTFKEIKDDRVTMAAAAMAYYWFLAVFPALIAAVGLVGLFNVGPGLLENLTGGVKDILPGDAGNVLADALKNAEGQGQRASLVAAIIGVAVALWSASSAMVALQGGLDVAYDVSSERSRKFLKKRLIAFGLIVATAVLGGAASALIVFGEPLGEVVRKALPFGELFVPLWTALRVIATILAIAVLFAVFYYLGPNRESPRWRWISPGGVAGALIWLLASLAFSFYVSSFGSYGKTYGSVAGVVLLILWLYLSALAVLVGGELNAELERQAAMSRQRGDTS